MSRYPDPEKVRADWWDLDESAHFKAILSFPEAQEVAYHWSLVKWDSHTGLADIQESAEHIGAALFGLLERWTLRLPGTPYREGEDRPKWELTPEAISAQPGRDLYFLFNAAMTIFQVKTTLDDGKIITPDAEADGLTPANFRHGDAVDGDIPGGSAVAEPGQSAGRPERVGRRSAEPLVLRTGT